MIMRSSHRPWRSNLIARLYLVALLFTVNLQLVTSSRKFLTGLIIGTLLGKWELRSVRL